MTAAAQPWTRRAFRRHLVDMHVPDWDPTLMARFDPEEYVACVVRSGAQSLMHYANSHVGLNLWRTRLGRTHRAMGERDWFGEVVAACQRRGIEVVAYFSVIFDNWAFQQHPEWRIVDAKGAALGLRRRYGHVCPNSPYREYALACIQEIAAVYSVAGFFFDMTFWPTVCYCAHCTARFRTETGWEAPRVVDWDDPVWRAFQDGRERWLLEFAQACTDQVHRTRPRATVNHQFSSIFRQWQRGVPLELAAACDYVGGDFYGGPTEHSLVCKAFESLTVGKKEGRPFEYHTSRTRGLGDHVTVKPLDVLRTETAVATLHSAALLLIDAIDVNGTLNPAVYAYLGQLTAERSAYEPFLGGELLADVAVYYDKRSMYLPSENGLPVTDLKSNAQSRYPHLDGVVGAARLLREAHLPYGLVTNATLEQLDRYRAVVLPSVLEMTVEQAERFRAFVERGGVLYASGPTSLHRTAAGGPRYLLEDVLGLRYEGVNESAWSYLTPSRADMAETIWPQDHLTVSGSTIQATALPGAEVLGVVTPPFVPPERGTALDDGFASIHSNPPAIADAERAASPALVVNRYGRGAAVWCAASLESVAEPVNARLLEQLLRGLLKERGGACRLEVTAHPCVEATLYDQPEQRRWIVGLANVQGLVPAIPVEATVQLTVPQGAVVRAVRRAPDLAALEFRAEGRCVTFRVPAIEVIALIVVDLA